MAAEFRIQKPKVRTGEFVIVGVEMIVVKDLAKETADVILAGAIGPGIVIVTGAAEVEAEIAGVRTEMAMSDPAAVMMAMPAVVAAAAPLLSRLPRPAVVSALLRGKS